MATPTYTYYQPSPWIGALQGAQTALAGIAQEKAAAQESKDQLLKFADILESRGMTGDAEIYKAAAENQSPNYLGSALSGKATSRDNSPYLKHALSILESDRDRAFRREQDNLRYSNRGQQRPSTAMASLQDRIIYNQVTQHNNEANRMDDRASDLDKIANDPDRTPDERANAKIEAGKLRRDAAAQRDLAAQAQSTRSATATGIYEASGGNSSFTPRATPAQNQTDNPTNVNSFTQVGENNLRDSALPVQGDDSDAAYGLLPQAGDENLTVANTSPSPVAPPVQQSNQEPPFTPDTQFGSVVPTRYQSDNPGSVTERESILWGSGESILGRQPELPVGAPSTGLGRNDSQFVETPVDGLEQGSPAMIQANERNRLVAMRTKAIAEFGGDREFQTAIAEANSETDINKLVKDRRSLKGYGTSEEAMAEARRMAAVVNDGSMPTVEMAASGRYFPKLRAQVRESTARNDAQVEYVDESGIVQFMEVENNGVKYIVRADGTPLYLVEDENGELSVNSDGSPARRIATLADMRRIAANLPAGSKIYERGGNETRARARGVPSQVNETTLLPQPANNATNWMSRYYKN